MKKDFSLSLEMTENSITTLSPMSGDERAEQAVDVSSSCITDKRVFAHNFIKRKDCYVKAIVISVVKLAVMFTGCVSRIADFTIASTKNIQLNRIDMKTAAITRDVESKNGRLWFLIIPFVTKPKIKEAMDNCLEKGKGDFRINAVVYEESWSLLLFSRGAFKVKGDLGNSMFVAPVYK